MELTGLQQITVDEILSFYSPTQKVRVDFKAPTGSGKTLMASHFISALIEQNVTDNFIFVIATPSSSSLPEFFEKKINFYKRFLNYAKFEVEYIPSPSSAKAERIEWTPKIMPIKNKVYIFGKSSFGKGRILSESGIIDDFIIAAIDSSFKLIYIRDEAHIGDRIDNSDEAKQFEKTMQDKASFILKMTATPNYNDHTIQRVILKERDLNNGNINDGKYLLKTTPVMLLNRDIADNEILQDAISVFNLIKAQYKALRLNPAIRPAMLIQVDNESFTDKQKQKVFDDALFSIKSSLNNNALTWVQYFGNNKKDSNRVFKDKFTLDDITNGSFNDTDCIIFKIGPSTGWDIPRACMLVQIRNVSSVSLNIQTIGRIKRNPYPGLEKNETTDKYFVYSNTDNIEKDFRVFNYKVSDDFKNELLASVEIINKQDMQKNIKTEALNKDLEKYLLDNKSLIEQQLNSLFSYIDGQLTYRKIRHTVQGKSIFTPISNPFLFLKYYKQLLQSNSEFNRIIKSTVVNFHRQYYAKSDALENYSLVEFFITVLLENHRFAILNIVNKNKIYDPKYAIKLLPYDSSNYIELYDADTLDKKLKTEKILGQPYLFNIKNGQSDVQPLDSTPEAIAFIEICKYNEYTNNIKVWAKNLLSSNVNGEYLDENNNIRHSYFDFIIKFQNNYFLYIEVKSTEDIDERKTQLLRNAYANYFKELESKRNQSFLDTPLLISIWKIDKQGKITQETFYDKTVIDTNLNALTVSKSLITIGNLGLLNI
ncbi:MAG: DEAD/DEAH box helicase family protein [Christensenellaceae bacterium]|jgi:type III restriction enzyme|nr:DEAD/DEAH box helicase family protein [Christensenellaceae bacterium]